MSNGRFGIHGGQYIPETLMNAVIELEEAYNHYKNDPEFNRELTELLNEYAGRPSRLYYAEHMTEGSWRSKDLFEERRFEPHRRPQDQQRLRSGASCKENGQNPCHRGNRSRTARRGDSHSGGAYGNGMRGLHGQGRHRAPGAKCIQDASPWSKSSSGNLRNRHPEGCRFRDNA